jgi:hypothetical protein
VSFYKVRAPNLPRSLPDYNQGQQDQFGNALRLYFNQLDASLAELVKPSWRCPFKQAMRPVLQHY